MEENLSETAVQGREKGGIPFGLPRSFAMEFKIYFSMEKEYLCQKN